jgi:hypothetical protein
VLRVLAIALAVALVADALPALAAGNVVTTVQFGALRVVGDDDANAIRLYPGPDPDSLALEPLDATTTVDGSAGAAILTGITAGVRVDLGAGDDELVVEDAELPAALEILGGDGADHVTLDDCHVHGGTHIAGGGAGDTIVLGTTQFDGKLVVQSDSGDDVVSLDTVSIAQRTKLATGVGNDQISIVDSSLLASDVTIMTAAGDDVLSLDGSSIDGRLHVALGDGGDGMTTHATTCAERVRLNGGGGTDTTTDAGDNAFARGVDVRKFEVVQ